LALLVLHLFHGNPAHHFARKVAVQPVRQGRHHKQRGDGRGRVGRLPEPSCGFAAGTRAAGALEAGTGWALAEL
jgi:hypothetical protein